MARQSKILFNMRPILFLVIFLPAFLAAQNIQDRPSPPSRGDFSPIHSFLSSDWMEGRETGTRANAMAGDYVASMMQLSGLKPFGDGGSWFQHFEVVRYDVAGASLSMTVEGPGGVTTTTFTPGSDFTLDTVPYSGEGEAGLVFAGYGIEMPELGYDSYGGADVQNKVLLILEGFPGHLDTTTAPGKDFQKEFGDKADAFSKKMDLARKKGAAAVIYVETPESAETTRPDEPWYEDYWYYLPGGSPGKHIPCFKSSPETAPLLFNSLEAILANGVKIRYAVTLKQEAVAVRNVLGLIPGRDTTRYLLVGAHYDHLGKRNDLIYNGADDNASGVAGMLALAKWWAAFPEKPACNLVFAAWAAEEKGVLGSEYFSINPPVASEGLSLVINLDMISRSAPEDTARQIVSIGTLPANGDLRDIAIRSNAGLEKPFSLDLWDVSGHCGSDYCHFAAANIPVMTFFSGFHEHYHSPGDIFSCADPAKMEKILKIVNDCIAEGSLIKRGK